MTASLERLIVDLMGGVVEAADQAPLALRQLSADLPAEFGLRRAANGVEVAAQAPHDLQARDLCTPISRLNLTIAVEGGHDV